MTGQTLTQRTEVERERKVSGTGNDVSEVAVGDVLTFEVIEYGNRKLREELVIEIFENGLTILFRRPPKLIISESRYINDNRQLNSNAIHGEEKYSSSKNIARQRIYDSLNQLLNEHGITE